jgi:hypothetical protein
MPLETKPAWTLPKTGEPVSVPEQNPTPTNPLTIGPVVGKGPVTESAPLNFMMGSGIVGATQAGFAAMTSGPEVLGTSVFLNLISQVVKRWKWFPEHTGLIVVMLVASFVTGYFVLFDHNAAKAFLNMANSTMAALVNYKGDKAAGLNVLAPVPEHLEYAS